MIARLTLALGLRLARHGVFQSLRNFHVANLDRLHRDAPRIRLLIENALQFAPQGFAFGDHLRQFVAADRFAQCGLRAQLMASTKFSTSRMDFSAFQTIQKTMASTLTGTVSRVSVDSAETLATRTR